ncbi:MAG: glycosyltransferase family 2 protein [Candidatus Pacearchaeota archaeon]
MFIRSDIFEEANGFDSNMTYHADQDLAKRVRQLDYKVKYTPNLKAKHLDMDTFGENREKQIKEKVFYFFSKHWEMSRKVFDQLYSW